MADKLPPAPPERTLRHWLARVARDARESQPGTPARVIAQRLGTAESNITRFERGEVGSGYVDQYLAAYAELLGDADASVKDPRAFYDRALARWRASGETPIIEPRSAPVDEFGAAADRTAQRRVAQRTKPVAGRKRKPGSGRAA